MSYLTCDTLSNVPWLTFPHCRTLKGKFALCVALQILVLCYKLRSVCVCVCVCMCVCVCVWGRVGGLRYYQYQSTLRPTVLVHIDISSEILFPVKII